MLDMSLDSIGDVIDGNIDGEVEEDESWDGEGVINEEVAGGGGGDECAENGDEEVNDLL